MPAKKAASKAGGKKGPPAAAVAAMRAKRDEQLQAERKAKEEEEARLKEEEEREQRRLQEEKEKADRKEKAAQERERLLKEGKVLSKEDQKKLEAKKKQLERLRASGMLTEELAARLEKGEDGDDGKGKGKKKACVATTKKRKPQPKKAEPTPEEEQAAAANIGSDVDDWEAAADAEEAAAAAEAERQEREAAEAAAAAAAAEKDDVPDSWDSEGGSPTASPSKAPAAAAHADPVPQQRELRSPICTVMGHVDTGKTKLLDCIRRTNVQSGEAGGITQQIGASFFPVANILEKTESIRKARGSKMQLEVPGLLVIDTPGHESFENLRSRGSNLCDIAILVVDIMHGLEAQTRSSIKLLQQKKVKFVVALNKIDRCYDWEPREHQPFQESFVSQKSHVQQEFQGRLEDAKLQFQKEGINAALYTDVLKDKAKHDYIPLVPTSAHTGEGIPDLLLLLVYLTQKFLSSRVTYSAQIQCTVLELKMVDGQGMTIDVILVNGTLREGDTIVVCGLNGPIVTQIRALLLPHPMKEIRVKGEYKRHKEVKAAMGLRVAANDLEGAIPGTPLLVHKQGEDIEDLKAEVMKDVSGVLTRTQSDKGVLVQASTLGALEALLSFLSDVKIPVSTVGVGPIHKKDVMRVLNMKERHPMYAVILAFDVELSADGRAMAEKEGIKVFTANIIYHLEDNFKAYLAEYNKSKEEENRKVAVFPCHAKLSPGQVFNKKHPLVLGLEVAAGQLRPGTPLFTLRTNEAGKTEILVVGNVESLQMDHKEVQVCRPGGNAVAVKINCKDESLTFGRQVSEKNEYFSLLSRQSIDALKESFRDDMTEADWKLVIKLKKLLAIQ
eukprot:TRINITY_DN431_c0_g1_i1.p1 TRINITY_DN431_c0_g1~~TRINITY_DN431_c0_g1_i1.p1  ORF type:complete len:841 (+),score=365.96 TRINITY_DN431_c0_g1_i1:77-2599(+)